jgi:hypothetical protein
MKVVIFDVKYSSIFSILCALVTGQSSSHAAIIHDGDMYDTTLTRGHFGKASADEAARGGHRQVTVFDIPDVDAGEWIKGHLGVGYDYIGLAFWPFDLEDDTRTYCFQAVSQCLQSLGIGTYPNRVSAKHLFYTLMEKGYKAERTVESLLPLNK